MRHEKRLTSILFFSIFRSFFTKKMDYKIRRNKLLNILGIRVTQMNHDEGQHFKSKICVSSAFKFKASLRSIGAI